MISRKLDGLRAHWHHSRLLVQKAIKTGHISRARTDAPLTNGAERQTSSYAAFCYLVRRSTLLTSNVRVNRLELGYPPARVNEIRPKQ